MVYGAVKDLIIGILRDADRALKITEITEKVHLVNDAVPDSTIRSCLNLQTDNANGQISRVGRGLYSYRLNSSTTFKDEVVFDNIRLIHGESLEVMSNMPECCVHSIVTDPPYGLVEYSEKEKEKLRVGKGGVWRIPPSIGGCKRNPLPRFTTLREKDLENMSNFFEDFGSKALKVLAPGGNLLLASNPLVVHIVTNALVRSGFEARGQVIRLVQTMRGGDRPKGAEEEFYEVSVMPRSQWEPWIIMRKPMIGTSASSLRTYFTGGWRRISDDLPFGDVIKSSPTRPNERKLSNHPSLKPQALMRQLVRASLPLGRGTVLDPFAGGGSTLAAAKALGYSAIGIELDESYFNIAKDGIPKLADIKLSD
ncbi:MAG: DNA-methyltransferase [Sutterella wadsworthensis]